MYKKIICAALFFKIILLGVPAGRTVEEDVEESLEETRGGWGVQRMIEEKKMALEEAGASEKKALLEELKGLEKELLHFPKRDRFDFGGDFDMTYDSNIDRKVIRGEEGDTLFRLQPFVLLDLGGRKTNLQTEFRWNRDYYAKVSEGKDLSQTEVTVRSGRKIGKKTTLSLYDRVNVRMQRHTAIEDGPQVRWDNSHRASLSHDVNRKLALNFEADYKRRDFPHERFDQDGDYQIQLDPNIFFKMTSKTRFSLGYRWLVSRDRTETSDATSREFRAGYFGRITGKSSLSLDVAYTFQDPDSANASRTDKVVSSVGYLWQATPKTSVRLFYSNSFEHALSDSISSGSLLKKTKRTATDALSLSLLLRPRRKITAEFSSDLSHNRSKTRETGKDNTKTRTFLFPFQAAIDYQLTEGTRLRLSYTYRHQLGNEEADEYRAHTLFLGTNLSF